MRLLIVGTLDGHIATAGKIALERGAKVAHVDTVDAALTALRSVRHRPPEATYLAWLDCREIELPSSPGNFFLEHAKVGLSDGPSFGPQGEGFVRLNFSTSRPILEDALGRMAKALRSR